RGRGGTYWGSGSASSSAGSKRAVPAVSSSASDVGSSGRTSHVASAWQADRTTSEAMIMGISLPFPARDDRRNGHANARAFAPGTRRVVPTPRSRSRLREGGGGGRKRSRRRKGVTLFASPGRSRGGPVGGRLARSLQGPSLNLAPVRDRRSENPPGRRRGTGPPLAPVLKNLLPEYIFNGTLRRRTRT